jgi:GLPGLI family protein
LDFNLTESLYEIEKTLEKPSNFGFFSTDSDYKKYQNLKSNKKIQQTEIFGKRFLIKEDLNKMDWVITEKKKKLGKYNCILAKTIEQVIIDDKVVVNIISAWFTTELPYSHGPNGYYGLPGLILELSNNATTIYCYKIELNMKKRIKNLIKEK